MHQVSCPPLESATVWYCFVIVYVVNFTAGVDMNRQPNKRRKRKPASSAGAGANTMAGSAMGGRIKRSPDPQNFTPILGVCFTISLI